jgi:hypothetical protein
MAVVVRGLEVAVGRGLEEKRQFAGVDPHGERALGRVVGAHPDEELARHLEAGLPVRRRLLGARERRCQLTNRCPVGHGVTIVSARA